MDHDLAVDDQIRAAVRAELETLSADCRRDAARLDAFLADDFHEYGRSGGEHVKVGTAVRVAQRSGESGADLEVEGMRATLVADGIVMIKYTSVEGGQRTNRTSLWRLNSARQWQMFHHQGTPTS